MIKRNLLSLAALSGCVFLAFGSTPDLIDQLSAGAGNAGNQAACIAYVEHYNALPCLPVNLDADEMCPAIINDSPVDMSDYYACLAAGSTCNGDIPDLSASTDCDMPY